MTHVFTYGPGKAVVETTYGKIRGYEYDNISIFKGIPYARARRFHAPEPVEPDPIPLYPAEVSQRTENGVTYIEKVYYLTAQDDPADIPTEDFERDGQHFTLQDVLKNSQMERDTKDHVEEVTVNSAKKDMESILPLLEPEIEVQTEDGYAGVLQLDHTSITVEAAGYSSSSRTVSATRTYPNLSAADVSLIPKTITDSGRTLTLADVQWQNAATTQQDGYDMALRYTATATYTGTATSQYANGYVVTASYHGAVTRVNCDVITYNRHFLQHRPRAHSARRGGRHADRYAHPGRTPARC